MSRKISVKQQTTFSIGLNTDSTGEVYTLSYEEAKSLYDGLDEFFGKIKDKDCDKRDTKHIRENPHLPENPHVPENPYPYDPWNPWKVTCDITPLSWQGITYHSPFEEQVTTTTRKG